MNPKIFITVVVLAVIAGGYGAYALGVSRGKHMAAPATSTEPAAAKAGGDPAPGKKVLYWHDPMVPGQTFDKPGKSPFMDMQLVPVYADAGGDESKVTISPRVQQNLGVRTAEVTRGRLASTIEAVGSVAYNERDVARRAGARQRLRRAPLRARAARSRNERAGACGALRAGLGRCTGGIPHGQAHGGHERRASLRCSTAHGSACGSPA